jgi:hypothetical protein
VPNLNLDRLDHLLLTVRDVDRTRRSNVGVTPLFLKNGTAGRGKFISTNNELSTGFPVQVRKSGELLGHDRRGDIGFTAR